MRSTLERPSERVCSAFGSDADAITLLPDSEAWHAGDLVFKRVTDRSRALWTARALDFAEDPGLRIAKPVRSRDGRWIVGDWTAWRYLPGTTEHRCDEAVLAAVRLHRVTADLPRPDFLSARDDRDAIADRIAWEELDRPSPRKKAAAGSKSSLRPAVRSNSRTRSPTANCWPVCSSTATRLRV